jgi:single-strand DNA-binding protein
MIDINSVLIEGDITGDPVFWDAPDGKAEVCTFSIASSRSYKGDGGLLEEEVCFFDVEARSKLAEGCYSRGHKGCGVRVVGRLKQERWDGDDGRLHTKVIIAAEHVEFKPDRRTEG